MAAIIATRRAVLSKLVERLITSPDRRSVAIAATRSFKAGPIHEYDDLDRQPESAAADRRAAGFLPFYQDAFDPFNPRRSLSKVLNLMNLMDQIMDIPLCDAAGPMGAAGGVRRGWDVKESADALCLRVHMPGLGKEHVKVWAEQNTLIIQGEGAKEPGEGEEENAVRKYSSRIDLPPETYKIDQIRAEMKNGVLKVVVPKVKEEERKDVFQISIEVITVVTKKFWEKRTQLPHLQLGTLISHPRISKTKHED